MKERSHGTPTRCLTVWLLASVGLGLLVRFLLPDLAAAHRALVTTGPSEQPFDRLLEWLCAAVAVAGCAWLWTVTTVVTAEAARGRAHRPFPGVPAPVRRVLLAACGVALAGGMAGPAPATPGELHQDRTGAAGAALVQGLPLPDRPTGALPGGARTSHRHLLPVSRVVVVRPGDTLWALAGQSPAWHRLYAHNRGVIGPDPDLIRPGQRLRLPHS